MSYVGSLATAGAGMLPWASVTRRGWAPWSRDQHPYIYIYILITTCMKIYIKMYKHIYKNV